MSQFKFWNDVNSLLSLDGPITKGPQPRYERKKHSNALSSNSSSLNSSKQRSLSSSCTNLSTKSPSRGMENDCSRSKTPPRTPLRKSKTPTPNKGAKTPGGDRFIPSRVASNLELAHFKLSQEDNQDESPSKRELKRIINENIQGNQRVLAYTHKAPTAPEGFQNPMRVLYSQTRTPASVKNTNRYIPQAPDRILDAPDIVDDYYLNLMDWGANNILAAALGSHVYLWNAGNFSLFTYLSIQLYLQ